VVEAYRGMQIVGTPQAVRARIEALVARTRADEVMVTTVTHDPAARVRSYQLLAAAFAA
jgi:alkanesulfonate monooxygenase SsuD/methylene tetrahydromethanopterin reductase-like flavin-dependent oxidoreductase (luciferase family)